MRLASNQPAWAVGIGGLYWTTELDGILKRSGYWHRQFGGKACQKLSIDTGWWHLTTMKTLLPPKIQIHLPLLT